MTIGKHPKEFVGCDECGAGHETWETKRRLPQIGVTYECSECGFEVYVYTIRDHTRMKQTWREVTDYMATNLQFFSVVGDWPDSATEDLVMQGVGRLSAIDYHIVKREGLTQTEWANMRGVDQSSVSENIAKARENL